MIGFEQPTRCVNCGGKPYAEDALGLPYCKNCVKGHDAYAQERLVRDPQKRRVSAMIGKRKVTEGVGVGKEAIDETFAVYNKAKKKAKEAKRKKKKIKKFKKLTK